MIPSQFIFETERLTVRRYNLRDDGLFYQLSGNEEVMRYIRPVVSKEDSDKSLALNLQLYVTNPNTGRWAVAEKASGNFVGSFSVLAMDTDNTKLHIGYALLPQFWGRGYASELLRHGIPFFFKHHSSSILYAITEEPNILSQKVLMKCGFIFHERLKEKEKDLLFYALHKDNTTLQ